MPLTVDDIIAETTAEEIEQAVLDLCATGGLPITSWQTGSVVRELITEISIAVALKAERDVQIAKSGFGDLATGDWVKLWAQEIYDVIFIPAAAATGYWDATNTALVQRDYEPGELILAHNVTGKTYRNQETISIPAAGVLEGIAIAADEVGTDSDAAPGDIDIVVLSVVGLTGSNPLAVLGADEESPERIVARTRQKLASFSPLGPKDAYNYVAKTPLDSFPIKNGTLLEPTSTPITRTKTVTDEATGNVTVYIATAGGAPTAEDVDRVTLGIRRWAEPWATRSQAAAASELPIAVTYTLWIQSNLTDAQIKSAVSIAVARYLATLDVGGEEIPPEDGAVYQEALENVIHQATPGIKRVQVTSPASEIVLVADTQIAVGTVSGTVVKL